METTGIVRTIDDLGRVVIPKEIRRALHIREGDRLELAVDGSTLCMRRYSPINHIYGVKDMVRVTMRSLQNYGIDKWALYDEYERVAGSDGMPKNMPELRPRRDLLGGNIEMGRPWRDPAMVNDCLLVMPIVASGVIRGYVAVDMGNAGGEAERALQVAASIKTLATFLSAMNQEEV